MLEGDLKLAVDQWLQYKQNAGELMYLRLNSGDFIEVRGDTRRRIKGCPAGTSDFMVVVGEPYEDKIKCYFIELKSEKGKQSPEQRDFQSMVEEQGASYYIVRSIEGLEGFL